MIQGLWLHHSAQWDQGSEEKIGTDQQELPAGWLVASDLDNWRMNYVCDFCFETN